MSEEKYVKLSDVDKMLEDCFYRHDDPRYEQITKHYVEIPIEDVAPVKHGKWLYCWSSDLCAEFEKYQGLQSAKCSVCNISQSINTYQHKAQYNYCPYCGAKMDELIEQEEEK